MKSIVVGAILLAAVGVTACGSSGSTEDKPTAADTTTTTTPSGSMSMPASGSSSHSATAPTPKTGPTTITIKGFKFQTPASVAAGAKITVTNDDSAVHTVTADSGQAFDVTVPEGGGTATFTAPSKPGSYPFHCTPHPFMTGTLVVK